MAAQEPKFTDIAAETVGLVFAWCASAIQAWPIWPFSVRRVILRLYGVRCDRAMIFPGCHFAGPPSNVIMTGEVFLNRGVQLDATGRIELEDGVGLGTGSIVITSGHAIGDHAQRAGPLQPRPVRIGAGTWVGARAVILPGVTIGPGCVIGAGALVTSDCEADGVYAGVPARRIRDLPA